MEPVSIVIPCYNPGRVLEESLASARAQGTVEIILVDDGTDKPESLGVLESLAPRADKFLRQPNRGLAAARNTGFRAAQGKFVIPLDADDRLAPAFAAECLAEIEKHPEAAFVYPDYRVFGDTAYVERLPNYNLYSLLDRNTLIYASLIRRADWETAGGYDEAAAMRFGYEDWEFWLRLAALGRFGRHLPRVLFEYRKSGPSLLTTARAHHHELLAHIRASHPALYSHEGRAQIKKRWSPAVCVAGEVAAPQTIEDFQVVPSSSAKTALEQSSAETFLSPAVPALDPHSAELAALAVWGGHAVATLPDGGLCASRAALETAGEWAGLKNQKPPRSSNASARPWPRRFEKLHRHLVNAGLLSAEAWLRHPLRSAGRLIPLRAKERVNRAAGRDVFDLSFYLKFQPESVLTSQSLVAPLRYFPRPAERRRIALVTPHLGPGGAESVLLEIAAALGRDDNEIFLIATQSNESSWRERWAAAADHVYDLEPLVVPERRIAALFSMALNWEFQAILLQNSLTAYSAIPHLSEGLPGLRIFDLIHAVDPQWDFVSASAPVASRIDRRVAISEAARRRLVGAGTPAEKTILIRNGIDLARFHPTPMPAASPAIILFAGRLDPVKRPLLVPEIAAELLRLRPQRDFRFQIAGDGPQAAELRERLRTAGVEPLCELLGHVENIPERLGGASIVLIPSEAEGIPLIALEAFAAGRPVVSSRVGAAEEAVDAGNGILIDRAPGEAGRFAAALDSLLGDAPLRARLGDAGRRKVEAEYDRDRSRQAYRDLFAS